MTGGIVVSSVCGCVWVYVRLSFPPGIPRDSVWICVGITSLHFVCFLLVSLDKSTRRISRLSLSLSLSLQRLSPATLFISLSSSPCPVLQRISNADRSRKTCRSREGGKSCFLQTLSNPLSNPLSCNATNSLKWRPFCPCMAMKKPRRKSGSFFHHLCLRGFFFSFAGRTLAHIFDPLDERSPSTPWPSPRRRRLCRPLSPLTRI